LEETVLAVQLHVPCDQVDDVVDIVDQVELEQAINTCLVHAVQPDVLSKVDVEIFWSVWLRNTGILNGGSTFDNDEFTKLPCLVHLGISLCQP
jgi:endonuclease IV